MSTEEDKIGLEATENNNSTEVTPFVEKFSQDIIKDTLDESVKNIELPDDPGRKFSGVNEVLAHSWASLIERWLRWELDKDSDALFIKTLNAVWGLMGYNTKEKIVKHQLDIPKLTQENVMKM